MKLFIMGLVVSVCKEENDVAILVDVSSSMATSVDRIRDFLVDFVTNYIAIGEEHTHLSLVTYSSSARMVFGLHEYYSTEDMVADIQTSLVPEYGGSKATAAFRVLTDQVFGANGDPRPDKRQVAVVFTDGNSNDVDATLNGAAAAKERNIEFIVVAMGKWVNTVEVRGIASDPDDLNVLYVEDIDKLGEHANSLRNLICAGIVVRLFSINKILTQLFQRTIIAHPVPVLTATVKFLSTTTTAIANWISWEGTAKNVC